MHKGGWRFAVVLAVAMAAATFLVAWVYDLPVRDPDHSVAGPTFVRFPLILLIAFLLDAAPRALWRARNPLRVVPHFREVVRERWDLAALRYVGVGLAAWYVIYAAFRNLKSYVPFVNPHLWDGLLGHVDHTLWFGNDPAVVLHEVFGEGVAAYFFSYVYIAWIVMVPASLAVALVWTRNTRAGTWWVTAIGVDWVLGVVAYYLVPTLGPVYARPAEFASLPHTDVATLQVTMMDQRHDVLVNPFTTDAVQTIAAFPSLHVGIAVTMCLMLELLRLPRLLRLFMWVFLGLTVLATIYLGWHYFVDALSGAVLGVAAVWIAARGTGNPFRRIEPEPEPERVPVSAGSRAA